MSYLALFTIKNSDFDYSDYGLTGNSFVVDVTKSIQAQKQVNFTQYPLLDGTTRIANVSRQAGTINFQGMIGDVYHRTSNADFVVSDNEINTRTQNFVRLLEALRDQAIVLDITTENKTFNNYLIESVGFGIAQFGALDVNFSMREYLAFGKTLAELGFDYEPGTGIGTEAPDGADYDSYLNNLSISNFTTDFELHSELFKILNNFNLAEPFIITFGGADINADVRISPFNVRPPQLEIKDEKALGILLTRERDYTPTQVIRYFYTGTYSSGKTSDGFSLDITLPTIDLGSLVSETLIEDDTSFLETNAFYRYKASEFQETGKHPISIKLLKESGVEEVNTYIDLLVTPKYSDIYNGINPYGQDDSLDNDVILQTPDFDIVRSVYSFIRKTSDPNVYKVLPNLLKDIRNGYLYAANYIKKINDNNYLYQISFVYIHPNLIAKIRSLIETSATFEITNLLYGKTIEWPWE